MKANFLTWQQAYETDVHQCGGKGWNLARLHHLKFNIPDGGLLSSDIYRQLMADPALTALVLQLQTIPDEALTKLDTDRLLKTIRQTIVRLELPTPCSQQLILFLKEHALYGRPMAVRSSATLEDSESASFAGIHESYLNVIGLTAVEQAILDCFASLWTLRAVSYRRKLRIDEQNLACAVVIMSLVDSQTSGIAFSCDPVTGREDITIINANFGLGESVVAGVIEPDEYRLSSHHMTLINRHIGSKNKLTQSNTKGGTRLVDSSIAQNGQALTEKQISCLGRLVQRIFWTLGKGEQHQDIEWAFDGLEYFLLQARPVTALPRLNCDALRDQADIWSNGNFRDAVPMVQSTLGASMLPYHIDTILNATFKSISYPLPNGLRFTKLFQGRAYCNASLMQWLYFDSFGLLPAATNRNMGGHQHEIDISEKARGGLVKKLSRGWYTVKLMRGMNRHKKTAQIRTAKEKDFAKALMNIDLTTLSDEELLNTLQKCDQQIANYALPFIMLTSQSGSVSMLYDLLEKYMPGKGTGIANALLTGAGDITSANHGYQLQELAVLIEQDPTAQQFFNHKHFVPDEWQNLPKSSPFKQVFQKFIDEYGHRAIYEVDLSNPRWREDPSYLLNVIKQSIGGSTPARRKAQQKEKTTQAWQTIKKEAPFYLRPFIKSLVKQAASGAASKEMAKSTYIRLFEPLRQLLLEAGKRFTSRKLLQTNHQIFHCAYVEVISILNDEWNGDGLISLVESRVKHKIELEKLTPPDLVLGDQPHYSKVTTTGAGNELVGMGVATGCAEGYARLIDSPEHGVRLNSGDVLIAPSTDPAWTPLFLNAAAIVMETGGQLSHGAIVAREYGIPAVVNIPGLLNTIKDGEKIIVNGDRGIVVRHI